VVITFFAMSSNLLFHSARVLCIQRDRLLRIYSAKTFSL
jgi:hypothetical protein